MPSAPILWILSGILCCTVAAAQAREGLPFPEGPLTAEQLAHNVYAATHGALVRNAVSKGTDGTAALVVNRAPRELREPGRRPIVQTFDTFVNNAPEDPAIDSMQMAILTSGKARGTGILFTRYTDAGRGSTIAMWLPALRKLRLINEPAYEDTWFGTNLTYGEIALRRPEDETHELLGEGVFEGCLETMRLEEWELDRYTQSLPEPQCGHDGKPVYRLKSATRFVNWWYDHHVSDIDKTTFSLYRTVYFKDGERIKTVWIDWQPLDQPDPRVAYPRYIYAVTHTDGKDSMVYVPRETIALDVDLPDSYWSADTLKRYGR